MSNIYLEKLYDFLHGIYIYFMCFDVSSTFYVTQHLQISHSVSN